MGWLQRSGRAPEKGPSRGDRAALEDPPPRRAPALAALFEALSDDGRHSLLDLGPADGHRLRLFSPYARQLRFAGPMGEGALDATALEIPENPGNPYDVVLAWDLLDRLSVEERPGLIARLARVTAPGARLYAVVDASGSATRQPVRITPVDLGHVAERVVGPPEAALPPLLPAQVESLLVPFEITHAFALRSGLREYVAVKGSAFAG